MAFQDSRVQFVPQADDQVSFQVDVTWFVHPANPRHPTSWHVRDDGWMSAAFNLQVSDKLEKGKSLTLRYGFHLHAKALNAKAAEERFKAFGDAPAWEVVKADKVWRVVLRRKEK